MRILLIFFFIIVSCTTISDTKVKKIYICGDHECANKKEMNDYFENNISIEIYTLSKSSKKRVCCELIETPKQIHIRVSRFFFIFWVLIYFLN